MELAESGKKLIKVMQCTYPELPSTEDERLYLMYFLYENTDLTARGVAAFVGELIGKTYSELLNEVYGAMSDFEPDATKLRELEDRMVSCGFGAWTKHL